MNEDGTPIEEQEEHQEAQANDSPGVLIDNNTGEETEPHPLQLSPVGEEAGEKKEAAEQDKSGDQEAEEGKDPAEPETPPETQTPEAPKVDTKPAPELTDPGEFTPKDYSFEVELADGTKFNIKSPEDVSQLPEDASFKSIQDHTAFINNYTQMVNGVAADKQQYEADKKTYEEQKAVADENEKFIQTVENSFSYLETKGKLPAVPAQYAEADWSDPEIAKQPGVKERVELVNYMAKENAQRESLGLPKMSPLEAHAEMQNKALEEAQTQRNQKQADLRKQRGAMISGQSAPAPGKTSSDMIVGSGRPLREL